MLTDNLLTLLAMGNWVNTPTPPNDPNAPTPVGNAGEMRLDLDQEKLTVALQSVDLSERTLTFRGEALPDEAALLLCFDLPPSLDTESDGFDAKALRQASMVLSQDSGSQFGRSETSTPVSVTGGTLTLTRATGTGPWEIDGAIELLTDQGSCSGNFEARVKSSTNSA